MAAQCRISSAVAVAATNAVADLVDVGGAGSIKLYIGAIPTYADDSAGTLVATCVLPNPSYDAADADIVNHWADSGLVSQAEDAGATGNAAAVTYFRLISGGGLTILQGSVGLTGSAENLELNAVIIGAGAVVDITELEIRCPYNQP